MDYIWIIYGLYMDYIWIIYGLYMDYIWIIYGVIYGVICSKHPHPYTLWLCQNSY